MELNNILETGFKTLNNKITDLKTTQSLEYTGENITCENTLTSRTSDVVVKGQTYQNVSHITFDKASDFSRFESIINKFENGFLVANSDKPAEVFGDAFTTPFKTIKPNTIYTIVLDVLENTLTMSYGLSSEAYGETIPQFTEKYDIPQGFVGRKIFTLTSVTDVNTPIGLRSFYTKGCSGKIKYRYYILEGDWTNKEVPLSITGIESAGEKENKISILSHGKNFANNRFLQDMNHSSKKYAQLNGGYNSPSSIIYLPKGQYKLSIKDVDLSLFSDACIFIWKQDKTIQNARRCSLSTPFDILDGEVGMTFYGGGYKNSDSSATISEVANKEVQIERNTISTQYEPYKQDKKEILLPIQDGLKSLPKGVCDTIEQRDDGVYLVQRVGKVVFNGSEDWEFNNTDVTTTYRYLYANKSLNASNVESATNMYCNILPVNSWSQTLDFSLSRSANSIFINNGAYNTVDAFKRWLNENNVVLYYELATPVETKLDINNLDLEVYKDITYVTTDNAIQPTLSFKVPSNLAGIIQENATNVNELYKLIDEVIIPQLTSNSADIEILKLK